jgi:hypothetical protein
MPIAVPKPNTNTTSLKDSKAHLARPKNEDGSPLYPDYMRELIPSQSIVSSSGLVLTRR